MIGPRARIAAQPEEVMIDGAADHSNNNLELNSPLSHLDPVSPFMLTILPRPSISSLPKHISIGVWNIRGNIPDKINEMHRFFQSSSCDILVLNETFRTPNSSWPRSHPPLLAESCSSAPTATRHPAGVAVIANRDNLHKLRSFSLLEFPCPNGTKVCLRINNFILLAVYIPPTSPILLRSYAAQARTLASDGTPVILCGDLNAHSTNLGSHHDNEAGGYLNALLCPHGPNRFFRLDTGPEPTRPNPPLHNRWQHN